MSNRKNVPAETQKLILVPLAKLKKSPKNVRKMPHTQADIEALAASISSLGMLQYPVIEPELGSKGKPTGQYLVNAGEGRRVAQLLRVKRREIKKDEPIPCILDTEHSATEISLAENAIRSAMHPADEYEAFAELHAQGMPAEDIAAKFHVTSAVVKQRLKLAAVSPILLKLYRDDEINLDQLTAFAITDDHERQVQVWNGLGWNKGRAAILHALTEGQVPTDDRRAIFVGLDPYEAVGGTIIRDLFEEDGAYLTDVSLLNRLVREKLQRTAEPVLAEGWKWVEVEIEFDHQRVSCMTTVDPVQQPLSADQQKRRVQLLERLETLCGEAEQDEVPEDTYAEIEKIEAEIDTMTEESFAPEDIARAGAFVALGHNGEARVERGYLRPEDARAAKGEGDHSPEAGSRASGEGGSLSAALIAELTAHRTMGLRNDLAQAPDLALIAVAHALAARAFYRGENLSCLGVALNATSLASIAPAVEDGVAGHEIAARHQAWAVRLPEEGAGLWKCVAALSMDDLLGLLAHCVSLSLDVTVRPGSHGQDLPMAHADELAKAMPHDMTRYWQPDTGNYLGRVSKDRILAAVREGVSKEAAENLATLKKQAMAEAAAQRLAGKGWLPSLLKSAPGEASAA